MSSFYDLTKGITDALKMSHAPQGRAEIGLPVLEAIREHFMALNAERHHAWAKGKGFYEDAANNTNMAVLPDGIEFVTNKTGLQLRAEGGVVFPGRNNSCITGKPTKYLSIPAIAEAHGHGACEFGNLAFVRFGKSPDAPAALIEKTPRGATWSESGRKVRNVMKQAKVQGAFGRRVWFWLVTSTTHKPDASVYPDPDKLGDIAEKSLEAYHAKFIR